MDAGLTLRFNLNQLTKEVVEKLTESDHFDEYWGKANASVKRKACSQYLELCCLATIDGSRHEFQDEWGGEINATQRKIDIDCQTAVAASQPATAGAAASEDSEQPATAVASSQPEDSQ